MASRGLAVSRLHPVGVPVQGKGVKALAPQVQHPAELLLLLLGVVPLQTAADPALAVSGVAAEGAEGRLLQGVLRQAQLPQQRPPLRLQAHILVPQPLHRRKRVRAPPQRAGDDAAHGGAKLALNLPQPGLAEEDLLPPGLEPGFPGLPVFLKPPQGPPHDLSVVGHRVPPSSQGLHVFPRALPGLVLPPGGGPVAGLNLLRRM